ncbi:MAG: hypothetical protein AB8G05_23490 [Oligoflexales bacterium]
MERLERVKELNDLFSLTINLLLFCISICFVLFSEASGYSAESSSQDYGNGSIRVLRKSKSDGGLTGRGELLSKDMELETPRTAMLNVIPSESLTDQG